MIRTKTTMHDVDFDLSDSVRALIRNGINIDYRTAVESALCDLWQDARCLALPQGHRDGCAR